MILSLLRRVPPTCFRSKCVDQACPCLVASAGYPPPPVMSTARPPLTVASAARTCPDATASAGARWPTSTGARPPQPLLRPPTPPRQGPDADAAPPATARLPPAPVHPPATRLMPAQVLWPARPSSVHYTADAGARPLASQARSLPVLIFLVNTKLYEI
jgi:hypothetical protein